MNDNPDASPKATPKEKAHRPLRVYFAAAWAGIFDFFVTFAVLTGAEFVTALIFFPGFLVETEAEFWRTMLAVANLVVAVPAGAWAASVKLRKNAA